MIKVVKNKNNEIFEAIQFNGKNAIECMDFTNKKCYAVSNKNDNNEVKYWYLLLDYSYDKDHNCFTNKSCAILKDTWILKRINEKNPVYYIEDNDSFNRLYTEIKEKENEYFPNPDEQYEDQFEIESEPNEPEY